MSNRNKLLTSYLLCGLALSMLTVFGVHTNVTGPLLGLWVLAMTMFCVHGAAKQAGLLEGRAEAEEAVEAAVEAVTEALKKEQAPSQVLPGMEMVRLTGGGPMDGDEVPAPLSMLRTLKMMLPPEASQVAAAMACFDDEGNQIGRYVFGDDSESNVMRWVPDETDE